MPNATTLEKPPSLQDAVAVWRMHLTGDDPGRIMRDSGLARSHVDSILSGKLHNGSQAIARRLME